MQDRYKKYKTWRLNSATSIVITALHKHYKMKPYTNSGAIKCDTDFDISNVKGKTAVITGGANGMGEAYVRALTKACAYVGFGAVDAECVKKV